MDIRIEVGAYTNNSGEIYCQSGGAVIVSSVDQLNNRIQREFGYWLGNCDYPFALLQCCILGLASVKSPARTNPVELYCDGSVKVAIANEEFADRVREFNRWVSYYSDLKIIYEVRNQNTKSKLSSLAERAMMTQKRYDSYE